jgi:hypothetical protein
MPRSAQIGSLQGRDLDQPFPLDRMKGGPRPLLRAAFDGEQKLERDLPVRDRPFVPAIYAEQMLGLRKAESCHLLQLLYLLVDRPAVRHDQLFPC